MKQLIAGFIGKAKDLKNDNFVVKGKISKKEDSNNDKK